MYLLLITLLPLCDFSVDHLLFLFCLTYIILVSMPISVCMCVPVCTCLCCLIVENIGVNTNAVDAFHYNTEQNICV